MKIQERQVSDFAISLDQRFVAFGISSIVQVEESQHQNLEIIVCEY
jgi:hypothetical protein